MKKVNRLSHLSESICRANREGDRIALLLDSVSAAAIRKLLQIAAKNVHCLDIIYFCRMI